MDYDNLWLWIGFAGQGLFFGRFFVQWIASERRKRSVVPNAFWYFSLGGGLVLLAYAIHRHDPVFMLGQASGLLIYSRNLWFIHRRERGAGEPTAEPRRGGDDPLAGDPLDAEAHELDAERPDDGAPSPPSGPW